jgi:hypothetical protein
MVRGRTVRPLSFDMTWTARKITPSTVLHFHENIFTELLPCNNRGIHRHIQQFCCCEYSLSWEWVYGAFIWQQWEWYKYRHTDWLEGFMKYAAEMGSGAMIYTPSFIKWFSYSKLGGGGDTEHGDHIGLPLYLYSFKISKEG